MSPQLKYRWRRSFGLVDTPGHPDRDRNRAL